MNYYERHLGDYARDAAHLSMLEHGAYCLLLDRYYITEQGISAEQAHRLCRAKSREEKAAVDAVLAEFFTLTNGAWVNGRAEREISKQRRKESALKDLQERDVYRRFRRLVLDRDGELCAYCGAVDVPLQLDPFFPEVLADLMAPRT